MTEKISILIPTKGRHKKLRRLIDNIFSTSNDSKNVEIVFHIDSDDVLSLEEINNYRKSSPNDIFVSKGKDIIFSDLWNHCIRYATGNIFMICGDDVTFKTQNWDLIIREEFSKLPEDKIGYICVNDEIHRGVLGVHGFVHRNWVNVLEYITPKDFIYCWADNWVDDIAKMIDRRIYLNHVIVSHDHWINKKSEYDETYRKNQQNYEKVKSQTEQHYVNTLSIRQKDAEKLKEFILSYSNKHTIM